METSLNEEFKILRDFSNKIRLPGVLFKVLKILHSFKRFTYCVLCLFRIFIPTSIIPDPNYSKR